MEWNSDQNDPTFAEDPLAVLQLIGFVGYCIIFILLLFSLLVTFFLSITFEPQDNIFVPYLFDGLCCWILVGLIVYCCYAEYVDK